MDFGEWIASIRTQKKISLRALARQTGVPFSTLQRIESARPSTPSLRTALQLCRALAVTVDQFLTAIGETQYVTHEEAISSEETSPEIGCEDILKFIEEDSRAVEIAVRMLDMIVNHPNNMYNLIGSLVDEDRVVQLPLFGEQLRGEFAAMRRAQNIVPKLPFFGSPVFELKLLLPQGIGVDHFYRVFLSGGALSLKEIGRMIRRERMKKFGDLAEIKRRMQLDPSLHSPYRNSISTISRIERGRIGSLHFTLWLSKILYEDYRLINMYWNAPAVFDRRSPLPILPGPWLPLDVDFYITLSRWLSWLYGNGTGWTERLRNEVSDG